MRLIKVGLMALILVLTIGGVNAQGGPNPPHDGEFTVPGLNDTVEILRDEWGVPHIYASNLHDLLFAQGYTQAMDRWWQMEFFRATASGTIQELTGFSESLMGTDAYLRTLGFRNLAEIELETVYTDDEIAGMQAFSDGVNAYIMSRDQNDLALEYRVLGLTGVEIEVAPWTPVDSLIWSKVMALQLASNQGAEQRLSRLTANLDPALLADYFVDWPYGEKPTIVPPEELPVTEASLRANRPTLNEGGVSGVETALIGGFEMDDLRQLAFGNGPGIGSNNWVVSGDLTETGLPLMANDMHLGLDMPSIWYEVGLHCMPVTDECPYDVVGLSLSPSPWVIAGHNADIAWALTNVGPDTQDLYQITVNPENDLQYEWDGEWRDMTTREETLSFGDGTEPITFIVRETHLGPIINDTLEGFNNDNPLALRWTLFEPSTVYRAFAMLNRASNWEEFREALSYWDSPSQNLVYMDVEGNIGYQTPGQIPIRAPGHSGLLPVPGNSSDFEWLGTIPFDLLPRVFNPEQGYIATANQAVVPLEYYDQLAEALADEFGADANYFISQQWAYGYRGQRINELLQELTPHSVATFDQIHGDNMDISAREMLPYFADLDFEDDTLNAARDWLLTWDYQMNIDSGQAALWAALWSNLVQELYNDEFSGFYSATGDNVEIWATRLLMDEPDNAWWDNVTTQEIEARDDILQQAFINAFTGDLVPLLGEDYESWQWGDLHAVTFISNPLGVSGVEVFENQVNRGPAATGGTNIAVNATSWNPGNGNFAVRSGPSQRSIYDASNWDNSLSIHTTGQSGHPASENYDDMIDPWRLVEQRSQPFSREAVEASATDQMILQPE
jgi:penicillin G amidase